ncbi:hypothetical protein SK128_023983 [Halocaridina rubra]|uniref:Little elongation complex subunit 2 C-terminal domain-containing protein n=1 Tax=Halocaridina rubra TaxID=373956 RepID=A0AAN9A0J2_HALRR
MDNDDKPRRKCSLVYIPNLFKIPLGTHPPFKAKDPFISPETLDNYCSILSSNDDGIPNYLKDVPDLDDVIDISKEDWKRIETIQEERESKAKKVEEEQKLQKSKNDSPSKQKDKLETWVDNIFKKRRFFVKKACPVMIPYKSSLSHEEHRAYLRAFVKFQIRAPVTATENAEYENYLRLQNRVYVEQQEFMKFSLQVSRLMLRTYNEVPENINKFITEYVQKRRTSAHRYKQMYVQEQSIPLCPQDPQGKFNDLYFKHIGHLLSLGCVPFMKLPSATTLCKLPIDDTVTNKVNGDPEFPGGMDEFLYKTPVSEDSNVIYLAKKHRANIVVSTSALKVIVDNSGPSFDKEWDVPVVIRNYTVQDVDGKKIDHRIVFIDKPMPKKIWTPVEKKQLFYKKSAQVSLTEVKNKPFFKMKCPLEFRIVRPDLEVVEKSNDEKSAPDYNEDFLDFYSTSDHDIFGPSSSQKKPKRVKKAPEKKRRNNVFKEMNESHVDKSTDENSDDGEIYGTFQELAVDLGERATKMENQDEEIDMNIEDMQTNIKEFPKRKILRSRTARESPKKSGTAKNNVEEGGAAIVDGSKSENKDLKNKGLNESGKECFDKSEPSTSSGNSNNVLDALLDMQDILLKTSSVEKSNLDLGEGENGSKGQCTQLPWSNSIPTDWDDHLEPKSCIYKIGSNVHYQLFEFGYDNTKPYDSSQPLRVIVRSNLHGLSQFSKKRCPSKAYVIHAKPEYQAYFGCEVNTLSEITQQWLELLVRPNAYILEVRVFESSGDVLKLEHKDMAMVLKNGKQPHIGFSPQQPLATLFATLSTLTTHSTGNYLMHHDAKTGAFIKLMKAVIPEKVDTSQNVYDFHGAYISACAYTRTFARAPWLAIDTHILTAFHLRHYKIPGTFPMDNPMKKLTSKEKKNIKRRAKFKRKLEDLKPEENCHDSHY